MRVAKEERRQTPSEFGPACVVDVPESEWWSVLSVIPSGRGRDMASAAAAAAAAA